MSLKLDRLEANVVVRSTEPSPDGPNMVVHCSDGEGFEVSFTVNSVYAPKAGANYKVVFTREEPHTCFGGR